MTRNKSWKGICWILFIFSRISSQEAYVQPSVFYTSGHTPYLDLRIYISDKVWKKVYTSDSLQSMKIDLMMVLKNGENIIKAAKFQLHTPPSKSSVPFYHGEKWELTPGLYLLETSITDAFTPEIELSLIDTVWVKDKPATHGFSDIQLLQYAKTSSDSANQLWKNGIYGEPLPYHTYYAHQHILFAYVESYLEQNNPTPFYLKFTILRKDSFGLFVPVREWFKKRKAVPVDAQLIQQDISELTSGSYQLKIQLMDKDKQLICEENTHFIRENPFWDRIHYLFTSRKEDKFYFDTIPVELVDYGVRAVHPLITGIDVSTLNNLLKEKKEQEKRIFLFTYFSERYDTARIAFMNYLKLAKYLDQEFKSGFGYGFETDRGIMYLRYGRPDEIIKEDKDHGAFPYEIWKYNKIAKGGQTNVKFLFYNPDLAGSDFRLLHSTAIGERFNRKWEIELYKNAKDQFKGDNFFDATEMQPGINRRAREYFDN
ncbi:MAG: GWxTD domain-containing protein [Saprospiraceae bacterium]|nr:GWxTD domain-containing protein [Saprospiraceae bacterium]